MSRRVRQAWPDALRIIAAFLVIVNHTNSDVFQASAPAHATWWLSVLWYYISKIAVPVFVIVSGACLTGRVDGYRRTGTRFLRILLALLVFSYAYFLYDAHVSYGLWPRMVDFGAFLSLVWTQQITDSFWYLYFYLGMLLMLPMLQRLDSALTARDRFALVGVCFAIGCAWPLAAHYVPALTLPSYFFVPMFSGYLGLFYAGSWLRTLQVQRRHMPAAAIALVLSLALSVALTRLEYARVLPGEKYWFMDDRMLPSLPTVTAAISACVLAKGVFTQSSPLLTELGGCAFGIYLVQDWIIAQSQTRLFKPLCNALSPLPAVLLWEAAVLIIALAAAWVMRRIPLLKKLV